MTTPTVKLLKEINMKDLIQSKERAIKRVLDKISENGYPTTQQLLFLQMFYREDVIRKEKK